MKKALSLSLAFILCLSLCACLGETQAGESTEALPEIISVDTLFEDVTNGAKCTLNVGKQVTVLGQIESISAQSCTIQLISHPGKKVSIRMPIEKLAALSVDHFVAAIGIVDSYDGNYFSSWYTISATEPLDKNETDAVFREIVAGKYNYNQCYSSYRFKNAINILCEYMVQRGSLYTMESSEELQVYLQGTWDCGCYENSLQESSFRSIDITYNADGSTEYSIYNTWRDDWEVDDGGFLHSFFGEKRVYILSDDVFFCAGALPYVFVRQK